MLDFDKYKDEIVDSITDLKDEVEEIKELLPTDEDELTDDLDDSTDNDDLQDLIELDDFDEKLKMTIFSDETEIETNELILDELQLLNDNLIQSNNYDMVGTWLIISAVVISSSLKFFVEQISRW